jgi:hypothetical protein
MVGRKKDTMNLSDKATRAYCDYIEQMRKPESLGWSAKIASGEFGEKEICAHTEGGRLLGKHMAYADAAKDYAALAASHEKLVKAMKPFAALAKEVNELRHSDNSTCPWRLCAGDIRKAQQALSEAEKLTK